MIESLKAFRFEVILLETDLPLGEDEGAELAKALKLVHEFLSRENNYLRDRYDEELAQNDPAPNASDWTKQGDNK